MDSYDSDESNDNEDPCLSNWTQAELETLLHFVKQDDFNVQLLRESLPQKSEHELSETLNYFSSKANDIVETIPRPLKLRKKKDYTNEENITKWLELIQSRGLKSITDDGAMGEALAIKAQTTHSVDGVNFQKIYLYLSKAVKGEVLPHLDDKTRSIFNKCFVDCIKEAKNQIQNNKGLVDYLRNLQPSDLASDPPDPSDLDTDVSYKNLVINEAYNPLNIPLELLKKVKTDCKEKGKKFVNNSP